MIKRVVLITMLLAVFTAGLAQAFDLISVLIGPDEAKIEASIRYTVIGNYLAQFDEYSGQIQIDRAKNTISSVVLQISAASIRSNCGWCDNIVRSKQLLSVEEHPKIIFTSNEIIKVDQGYEVRGVLDLHGEKQQLSFPFYVTGLDELQVPTRVSAKGQWLINRKDFDIVWNRLLDKGGVLVGNQIKVDWEIDVPITN